MNYREQLRAELARRQNVNPRYSLRAFSKALGVSPSFLSKVLNGVNDLSPDKSTQIAKKLGYNEIETEQFCLLVKSNYLHARTASGVRPKIQLAPYAPISLEIFQAVSDWHHYGILYLINCKGFQPKSAYIAKRLGIPTKQASDGLSRLVSLNLIKKTPTGYARTNESIATSTDKPSKAIRHFHMQMIEKAKRALEEQSINERDITSITLGISKDKIPIAKEEIRKFRRKLAKLLTAEEATEVYQLNVQFFSLSK